MVKARAVTGEASDIAELQSMISPFVFRRYLDYSAIESLRELKRKIALSVKRQSLQDNIKLGSGGIREVEFIGQAFQLVRGGRELRLQIRPIRDVLSLLVSLQLLTEQEHHALIAAYDYLRRVENAVQMMRDEQVHSVPVDETDQLRLMVMMDHTGRGESHRVTRCACQRGFLSALDSSIQAAHGSHAAFASTGCAR